MRNKVIQMIKVSDNNSIFLCGFDIKTSRLKFRTAYEPNYLQEEEILIAGDNVKLNLYHFSIAYLRKFITENKLIK